MVNEPTLRSPTVKQMSAMRPVGAAQQRRGALEAAGEQVLVRCLAEGAAELAAEVRGGEMRGARERGDVERLPVAGIDEILGAEQMTSGRMGDRHAPSIAPGDGIITGRRAFSPHR